MNDFDTDALQIVLVLAECDPVAPRRGQWGPAWRDDIGLVPRACTLCSAEAPGAADTLPESQHTTSCPWRAARDFERRFRKAAT